jgi:hypothetical protein
MLKYTLTKQELPTQAYKLENLDPEIKCHCCNDTGKIQRYLVKMVIADYNADTDKQPICQRTACNLGLKYTTLIELDLVDTRFTHEMCEELHTIGKNKILEKPSNVVNIEDLITKRTVKTFDAVRH